MPSPVVAARSPRPCSARDRAGLRALVPALLAAALLGPAAARAQGHPMPPAPTPFHERLERADAVALVRVREVEPGRLHVERRAALRGATPERFAIKRAPSRPPALAAGDRAVVLLRGDRPPYVLATPREDAIRLADADAVRRWREALEALVAAGADPAARLRAYLGWLDAGAPTLAEAGLVGALAVRSEAPEPARARALERARAAADPGRDADARRLSALFAASTAEGTRALLEHVAREDPTPEVALVALRAGAGYGAPGLPEAFARVARHEDPELRLAALRVASAVALRAPGLVRGEVDRLAADDPEPGVRARAVRVRRSLGGRAGSAAGPAG